MDGPVKPGHDNRVLGGRADFYPLKCGNAG